MYHQKVLSVYTKRPVDIQIMKSAVDQPTSSTKQPEVHHLGRVVHLSRFPPANLAPGCLVLQQRLWKTWRHVGTGLARSWCVPETGWRSGVEHYPAAGKPNSEWSVAKQWSNGERGRETKTRTESEWEVTMYRGGERWGNKALVSVPGITIFGRCCNEPWLL